MFRNLLALLLLFGAALHAGAQDRGVVALQRAGLDAPTFDGKSFALVIGIDAYSNGWPRLSNAGTDADAISAELKRQGFEVTLRRDLGSDELENTIEDFVYERGRNEDSRLLIWFAGHGHTINGEAYLVPADAPAPEKDWEFRRKAMSMRDFGKYMREVRSRHVLAIFDSCFSGGIFETARAISPPAITRATSLPVRQMISSGEAEQTVSDDGTFRRLFIDALRGNEPLADANRDGFITGSELGLFLSDKVTSLSRNRQTPRYGKLRELGLDRGDFVFRVNGAASENEAVPQYVGLPAPVKPFVSGEPEEPAPEPPSAAAPEAAPTELDMAGGETALLLDGRLAFTMVGTPYGARKDLVGIYVNGKKKPLGMGDFAKIDDGTGQTCIFTLMEIVTGENRARFLIQCGPREEMQREGKPALTVALNPTPAVLRQFTTGGGSSSLLEPGGVVFTMIGTPFGARRDLVGVTLNGKRAPMAVGQQFELSAAERQCVLTVTKLHIGQNQADFLWRCG